MDDQVAVRMRQRTEHIENQPDAGLHTQRALGTVFVDACPLNVFQDEVGPIRRGDAGVDQAGDVRMRKPREQAAFPPEPVERDGRRGIGLEELERELSLETPVAALREPNLAHSPAADGCDDGISAHLRTDPLLVGRPDETGLQKTLCLEIAPVRHHFAQGGGDGGLVILEPRDVALPRRLVHLKQSIEVLLDGFPVRVTWTNFHARLPSNLVRVLAKGSHATRPPATG